MMHRLACLLFLSLIGYFAIASAVFQFKHPSLNAVQIYAHLYTVISFGEVED